MNRGNLELKVGIIGVLGIVILVAGSIWGRDVKLSSSYNQLSFVFSNSGGLRPGDPVTVNGIKKGRVETVDLHGRDVLVGITLSSKVKLYPDVSARISMLDLMGGTNLEIDPGGRGKPLDKSDLQNPIPGSAVTNLGLLINEFQSIKLKTDTLLSAMNLSVANLNKLLDEQTVIRPLKSSMAQLDKSAKLMNKVLTENESALAGLIRNSNNASATLRQLLQNKRNTLEKSIDTFAKIAAKMDTVSGDLSAISRQIHNRKGSLAKLIYEDRIYDDLQKTITGVDSLTTTLQKDLGRYLQNADVNLLNLFKF